MSRRDWAPSERYDDRQSGIYRRPRGERNDEELDIDITRSRYDGPAPSRRPETTVKERDIRETDTVITQGRRTDRGARQPEFLREDYGRSSNAGPLVVREERREDDEEIYRRAPKSTMSRRSMESMRSRRGPPPAGSRVEKDEFIFRERDRDSAGPPYPRSERDFTEEDEVIFRQRTRSRSRPAPSRKEVTEEKIDIRIHEDDHTERRPPPRETRERDVEEVRFRRGEDIGGPPPPPGSTIAKEKIEIREKSRGPPPARTEVDREEITFRERRSSPSRERYRGREVRKEEIDIDIRERSAPPPPRRSVSRGALVAKKKEEWVVRRPRSPSPSPPREYEKEQIIIRRKERTPSPEPEPPREPTPEPPPPPPPEPIYRPPIIQEVITHHRHIDHGVEQARSPTPPPPPSPPSPPREDNLEIEIRRKGVRNGKAYDDDIIIEQNKEERKDPPRETRTRDASRTEVDRTEIIRKRSVSVGTRRRSPSPVVARRRYDDDVAAEADYYNRRVSSRAYAGEAWNGATKDWGMVDIPPGTERVRMDGMGGGRQEITWDRYAGERRGKFITGDRVYEEGFGDSIGPAGPQRDDIQETRITERRITEETSRGRTREKMWTEISKDLVTKEAIDEKGYEFEENDRYFYVMEYLRYEDVLRLVELTDDIRRERRERIRELQFEREEQERAPKMLPPPAPLAPRPPRYDERVYEREYIYDRDARRYR